MDGVTVLERLAAAVERIADRLDPPPADIVDSRWVADRLGRTTTWIAEWSGPARFPGRASSRAPATASRGSSAGGRSRSGWRGGERPDRARLADTVA